jgi:threonine 3-dehydrogenase
LNTLGCSTCASGASTRYPRFSSQVIASDVSPYRLDVARRMNADAVIDVSKEDFVQRVAELTAGRGLDGVLEMSGNAK